MMCDSAEVRLTESAQRVCSHAKIMLVCKRNHNAAGRCSLAADILVLLFVTEHATQQLALPEFAIDSAHRAQVTTTGMLSKV